MFPHHPTNRFNRWRTASAGHVSVKPLRVHSDSDAVVRVPNGGLGSMIQLESPVWAKPPHPVPPEWSPGRRTSTGAVRWSR